MAYVRLEEAAGRFAPTAGPRPPAEGVMHVLLIVGAVLISLAAAVASAQLLLSVVFHFMSKLR